ncbi:MAG: trans-sulfuration enzyme family protein [Acidobacteriota bacterium]
MRDEFRSIDTRLIHAGEPRPRIQGAVAMPIFQSAMYEYTGEGDYHDLRYIRLNNTPNHVALHRKLASLENSEAALVTSSGMAAISTSLLTVLSAGDHLLAQNTLYGGTHEFIARDLPGFGISFDFIDGDDPGSWKSRLRPNTRAIYVESMTNPLLQVADLKAVAGFAREHGLVSLVDNTFPTPVSFRPMEHGFDLSLHSCTKYLNGHSDIVAGAVVGRADLVDRVRRKLDHLGGALDPHACFLLHRGLKTLALRVRQQGRSALELARMLERHPAVAGVNYPGLESHPRHRRAVDLFDGFSGMLSFETRGGVDQAERFMRAVRIPVVAPSLGGIETLLTRPATTSHASLAPEERRRLGISDALIRVSVGIEDTSDLLEDFGAALRETAPAGSGT